MGTLCLDASVVLAWLLPENLTGTAYRLRTRWQLESVEFVAPPMLTMEVPSALRQSVHRGRISLADGDRAFEDFLGLAIRISQPGGLIQRAWELGKVLNPGRLYDMYYLALAEIEDCELWTADRRLANLAERHPVSVRWIGDYSGETTND